MKYCKLCFLISLYNTLSLVVSLIGQYSPSSRVLLQKKRTQTKTVILQIFVIFFRKVPSLHTTVKKFAGGASLLWYFQTLPVSPASSGFF